MLNFPAWQRENWVEAPGNPVIGCFETPEAGYAIGDPQILVPGEFDGQWHAFYHGFYKDFKPFYQLDLVRWQNELRLYYNGRDKWQDGIECIGLSILKNDATPVRKLWDLSA